ncbi:hypothetical protein [Cephaloticoccus primus]|nr:hypothetical protein [Cephaloticoccus primus]
MPKSVQESLEGLASLDHSLIVIDTPAQGNALYKLRHPTTRFLLVDNETEYTSDNERYGRVPRLVIALQNREVDKSRAKQLRESFRDYREDEWSSHELDGWVIWQAGDAVAVTTNPSQS